MTTTDLALQDFVKLRLIDASKSDVKAVIHHTGILPGSFSGESDIVVRFVPQINTTAPIRHLVMGAAGFNGDAFFVFDGERKATLNLNQIGGTQPVEIVCETGVSEVPLLIWIVNLVALSKGVMPVHASAFRYKDHGIVASGWPKGGKTSSLFAFLANGAQFISDDWLHIDKDANIYGLLQPIKLSDWQLEQLPDFRARVSANKMRIMKIVKAGDALEQKVPDVLRRKFPPTAAYYLIMRYLNKKKRHVYMTPQKLFDDQVPAPPVPFETLFITLSHNSSDIVLRETTPEEALERLIHSLMHEWQEFLDYYIQFCYAFSDKTNPLIDNMEKHQRDLLAALLEGKSIYTVHHPHPVPLQSLFSKLSATIKG